LDREAEWRRILSNFHVHPFNLDGKNFNSIEHYIMYRKMKRLQYKDADMFTIDSGHQVGLGDGSQAKKN